MTDQSPSYRPATQQPPGSQTGRIVLVSALLAAIVLAALATLGWYLFVKPDRYVAAGKPVEIVIARGSGTARIAGILSGAGVVGNSLMFRFQAHQAGVDQQLKPGRYAFVTGTPNDVVIAQLIKGPNIVYYDVTIPEGFTNKQIAARFAARTGVSEQQFLALETTGAPLFAPSHPYLRNAYKGSLQGYLFPDTYRIKKGTNPAQIIGKMLDRFDAQIAAVDTTYARSKRLNLNDVVTIASIIEREVRLPREYPLVSSVIYNRLHAKMRLQLDSTVFFYLAPGTKVIKKSDLANQNPYNTYQHNGLPPGPLANPGLLALQAAAHPAKTKYYYYVLTGKDGSQTFATNYADFQKAVKKYHKLFGTSGGG